MTKDRCSKCGESFGYEIGWHDPPEGEGHIEATWNPDGSEAFIVGETRHYCSVECLRQDAENHPFGGNPDE